MLRKRINVTFKAGPVPMADLSNITSLQATLIRTSNYGIDDARNLVSIGRLIISGITLEAYSDRRHRLYGNLDKPDRDEKGRVIWTRRELSQLSEGLGGLIRKSEKTVIR